MIHDALLFSLWLIALPFGLFALAFLAALADCTYAYLSSSRLPVSLDDAF